MVVAFTFMDTLVLKDEPELYIAANASADLKDILTNRCNQRYVCLNNTADSLENNKQMEHLSEVVRDVVYLNGGKTFKH